MFNWVTPNPFIFANNLFHTIYIYYNNIISGVKPKLSEMEFELDEDAY